MDSNKKGRRRSVFLAGFFLTLLITAIGFAAISVWPTGDKTVLIIDSLHQYLPFYTDMHNRLVEGKSCCIHSRADLDTTSGRLTHIIWRAR